MKMTTETVLAEVQLGRMLLALAPRAPAPEAALRIRRLVAARVAATDHAPAMTDIRCDDGWKPFGNAAQMKVLHDDGRTMSWLLRLQAGAGLPAHEHDGAEECLVVSGDLWLNGEPFGAGDYQLAAAGSRHDEVRSDSGCLLLVRSPSPQCAALRSHAMS
jgi:anti-sigma factor ChrR (cupin superfamily)